SLYQVVAEMRKNFAIVRLSLVLDGAHSGLGEQIAVHIGNSRAHLRASYVEAQHIVGFRFPIGFAQGLGYLPHVVYHGLRSRNPRTAASSGASNMPLGALI